MGDSFEIRDSIKGSLPKDFLWGYATAAYVHLLRFPNSHQVGIDLP
jgi:hypothetical protein